MAVVISSDEAAHFAPGLRRSQSQPKFSSTSGTFRHSASTSRISNVYSQQFPSNQWPRRALHSREPSPSPTPQEQEPSSPSQAYQKIPVFSDSSATSSSTSSPRLSPTVESPHAASPTKLLVPSIRLPQRIGRPGYGSSPIGTDDGTEDTAIDIDYSHYEGVAYYDPAKDYDAQRSEAYAPSNNTASTALSRTNSSEFEVFQHIAEDDTAIRAVPSRHVDYLSHNWREEDIWESWKYIVSRRGDYSNSARLENASWRTWMKSKNKLKTVSPETLNWLKDCDVTWLYGPLQTGHESFVRPGHATDSVELTKSNSFLSGHKPILKKRSMSEMMLQRSISASSLLKQAAAAVQAQQKDLRVRRTARPRLDRAVTDYVTFPFSSRPFSVAPSTYLQSASGHSSGLISPSEKKHIHFNEQVEQCIAVDTKGDDDDEDEVAATPYDDSDSDDGAIMMKRAVSRHRMQPRRRHTSQVCTETKPTIAMLPSTTLKYRDDPDDDADDAANAGSAMKHSYRSPVLSPSSSQETLRPSRPSGRLFVADDEDDEEDEDEDEKEGFQFGRARTGTGPTPRVQSVNGAGADDSDDDDGGDDNLGMSMGAPRRRTAGQLTPSASTSRLGSFAAQHTQSIFAGSSSGGGGGGLKRTTSTSSFSGLDAAGMRRTASGMFMPLDEGEPADVGVANNGGLVNRIVDAVNTARDIVHVIWNVGWSN